MDGRLYVKDFISMDGIMPNTAAVRTTQHKRLIITLMGTDPKYPKFIRAVDKEGKIYRILKSELYILLTGRKA